MPAVLVAGCGHKTETAIPSYISTPVAQITEANQQSLLPMSEGNTWVYDAQTVSTVGDQVVAQADGEVIFRMTDVKTVGDATECLLNVTQGESSMGQSTWTVGPKGILQTTGGMKNTPYSQPEPVILFPYEKNASIKWSNSGEMPDGNMGSEDGTTQVALAPQIDTAVSTVSGIVSTSIINFKTKKTEGKETTSTWFQPGVGIVRLVQSTSVGDRVNSTTIRLKSWTVQHS